MEQFKVVKEIGRGGYGRALLVRSATNQQLKVVKELDLSKMSGESRESAMNEANVLSTLKHTNIIRYRGCTKQKKMLYILMDYADGGDLAKAIASRGRNYFPEDQILDWFVQICLAIKYLHDRKIMHRDLKPQNVFLSSGNIIKIGDFGISKTFEHTGDMAETAIGTPLYCSPEICFGHKYNSKSDIWSLGCILYELCSLTRPFSGSNIGEIMRKVMTSNPKSIPYQYSNELREMIAMMLKKNPAERASIYDILKIPLIRNKAIALLGKTQARIELNHQVFHGKKPGETPGDIPEEIKLHVCEDDGKIQLKEENLQEIERQRHEKKKIMEEMQNMAENLREIIDGHFEIPNLADENNIKIGDFYFMGRKLILNKVHDDDPLSYKLESIRAFLESMLGIEKFGEIYKVAEDENDQSGLLKLTHSDAYVFQLILQLVAYEKQL